MCTIARIQRFLDQWPEAAYGPAHIVLADANIEDGHIDWCIGLAEAALGRSEPDTDDRAFLDSVNWYRECDREELAATVAFLRAYRAIPEDDRIEIGDRLCD